MRHPLPPLHDEVAARKERRHHGHDGHKTPRLPMRYLLVSQPAQTRQDVARLLGGHRHAVSRWRALSAAGGLEALLAAHLSPGQPGSLAPPVLASLAPARRRPGGFASSEALRQWGRRTDGVEVKDETRSPLVRTRFHPERKAARPRPTQTP